MDNANKELRLPVEKLKNICNIEKELKFCKTSKEVTILEGVIGQDRAVKSMEFGLAMNAHGYNIFVLGPRVQEKAPIQNRLLQKQHQGSMRQMTGVISTISANGINRW